MTPSELAKVREALDLASRRMSAWSYEGQCPGTQTLSMVHASDLCTQALAILDREAGRKTRTTYIFEWLSPGAWFKSYVFHDRDEAEKYAATVTQFQTRILEVTESWEEPKA